MTPGIGTLKTALSHDDGDLLYSPLYRLQDLAALAKMLHVSLPVLWRMGHALTNYRNFQTQTGGKQRFITAPTFPLDAIQRQLWDYLSRIRTPPYLHSGRGRSHVTHAALHLGQAWLCKIDLRTFYLQISAARVRRFFLETMRCSPAVAALLTRLCTVAGHVPVGGRISQPLSFLVARPMFDELDALASRHGNLFSLYLDDLCFSGDRATPSFLWTVKQTIHRNGYAYHAARCYRPEETKVVAGSVLSQKGLTIPFRRAVWLRAKMAAVAAGELTERELESLLGHLAAASNIDPSYKPALKRAKRQLQRIREVRLSENTAGD